ncbi:hypothetical protein BaRGS_00014942 [Batillaria attramentaria]|uniref:Uncharacterized protein n=1 Tax=Batillaria attramentaria TaxID=370345 RepID=A0ABD0L3F9_9CAEN
MFYLSVRGEQRLPFAPTATNAVYANQRKDVYRNITCSSGTTAGTRDSLDHSSISAGTCIHIFHLRWSRHATAPSTLPCIGRVLADCYFSVSGTPQ